MHPLSDIGSTLYAMSDPDIYVPSQTERGPLHARDVEQARMPCFLGLDYPDDGKHHELYCKTLIIQYLTESRWPLSRNMPPLLRRHDPRLDIPASPLQPSPAQTMHR